MTRSLYLIVSIVTAMAPPAIAAAAPSFATATAKSAEKFKTAQGGQYGIA